MPPVTASVSLIKMSSLSSEAPKEQLTDLNSRIKSVRNIDDESVRNKCKLPELNKKSNDDSSWMTRIKKLDLKIKSKKNYKSLQANVGEQKKLKRDGQVYYTAEQIEKRNYLESLAKPLPEKMICFCFQDQKLVNDLVTKVTDPVEWGLKNEKPGIKPNRLGGRGLYVAKPSGLEQASRYAGRIKKSGGNPGLLTVHINKGAKFLDLTDKTLLGKLASKWKCSHEEAEHLASYLEPSAVCKFSGKDWLVIKTLENVELKHPHNDDFKIIKISESGKFDSVAKELIDSFKTVSYSSERSKEKSLGGKIKSAYINNNNYRRTESLNNENEDKFNATSKMVEYLEMYGDNDGFSLYVAEEINNFFSKKYQGNNVFDKLTSRVRKQNVSRYINGRKLNVYRPKHALAHGVRQGALSKDIVELISDKKYDGEMADWARGKLNNDCNFLKKIEFMSCFMRTGRKSEAATESRFYSSFLRRDANNFEKAARKTNLFSENEIITFKMALQPTQDGEINYDAKKLKLITKTAHRLDLRRLPHFDKERVQLLVASSLYGKEINHFNEMTATQLNGLNELWSKSGSYLQATGDRDLDIKGRNNFQNEFFTQAKNPIELVKAVNEVRSRFQETKSVRIKASLNKNLSELESKRTLDYYGIDVSPLSKDQIKRMLDQYGIDDNRKTLAVGKSVGHVDVLAMKGRPVSEAGLYISKQGINQYGDFDFVTKKTAKSYHVEDSFRVAFTGQHLDKLQKTYKKTPVTGFLKKFINKVDGAEHRNYLQNKALCDYLPPVDLNSNGHLIYPNPTYITKEYFTHPENLKNTKNGIQLLTWAVHPRNAAPLINEITAGEFHSLHKESSPSRFGLYTTSQLETERKTGLKSLTTILDLTKEDLPQLIALRKASHDQLVSKYNVDLNKDKVNMFFHFPVSIETATLHLHVFVNKGNLPLNEQRSFSIDEVINYLESGKSVKELILNRNDGVYYFPKKNIKAMPGMPHLQSDKTIDNLLLDIDN
ncbi:SidE phosphodiesterase domain-containing protein [Shewanella baltica]|uniref:SidE PDE domain-containing protein n=1 Tax=Shewanella baltica (strain OS155 / ATCC BAA-1091) TaxID=325240 RepID=A3DB74_SHEB5|nr:SidE phosphodiesterase domain-containing protein [Shewanella baltica]ABN63987.1 hypothetical protein Sbal_4438 [Shewanella baltica OS155]